MRTETLVDSSRPTDAKGSEPAKASRTLLTTIYYPTSSPEESAAKEGAAPATKAGGFPMVVFGPGSGSSPPFYAVLLQAWASAGYVVAAPAFPLSSTTLGAGADYVNQPKDISFVISEMLRLSSDASGPYADLVDMERIGVAGHSLGAMTALGVVFNSCCTDSRIKAAAVLAGRKQPFPDGTFFSGPNTPLLVVHGVADPSVPLAAGEKVFADASPPKLMLTVPASEVPGTDHNQPYAGTEGRILPATRVVITTTLGFFDRYLSQRLDALKALRKSVAGDIGFDLRVVES
jgi:dienelactone hydrolase